jgi:hypothetical protein
VVFQNVGNRDSKPANRLVWGGGNDHDRGTSGIWGVYRAAAFTVG